VEQIFTKWEQIIKTNIYRDWTFEVEAIFTHGKQIFSKVEDIFTDEN
jgi:hypothetical protein